LEVELAQAVQSELQVRLLAAIRKAQATVRKTIKRDRSLSHELMRERKEEAGRR
jgi:hypothetical protein